MIDALLLLLVANGAPVVANRMLGRRLGYPLDGNRTTPRGEPWLGRSKTVLGLTAAVIATAIAAEVLDRGWALGAVFALLAMCGDLLSSFIKRRLGLPASSQVPGLDQVPEALLPLILCAGAFGLHWPQALILVAVFLVLDLLLTRMLPKLVRQRPD